MSALPVVEAMLLVGVVAVTAAAAVKMVVSAASKALAVGVTMLVGAVAVAAAAVVKMAASAASEALVVVVRMLVGAVAVAAVAAVAKMVVSAAVEAPVVVVRMAAVGWHGSRLQQLLQQRQPMGARLVELVARHSKTGRVPPVEAKKEKSHFIQSIKAKVVSFAILKTANSLQKPAHTWYSCITASSRAARFSRLWSMLNLLFICCPTVAAACT